jgi:hypothetical protein
MRYDIMSTPVPKIVVEYDISSPEGEAILKDNGYVKAPIPLPPLPPSPFITSLLASQPTAIKGDSVVFTWVTANADAVTLNGIDVSPSGGKTIVMDTVGTFVATLRAISTLVQGPPALSVVNVVVNDTPVVPPPPPPIVASPKIVSFTPDKDTYTIGDEISLAWDTTDTNNVSISGDFGDVIVSSSGSKLIPTVTVGTVSFTLHATNSVGVEVTSTITVHIIPAPLPPPIPVPIKDGILRPPWIVSLPHIPFVTIISAEQVRIAADYLIGVFEYQHTPLTAMNPIPARTDDTDIINQLPPDTEWPGPFAPELPPAPPIVPPTPVYPQPIVPAATYEGRYQQLLDKGFTPQQLLDLKVGPHALL